MDLLEMVGAAWNRLSHVERNDILISMDLGSRYDDTKISQLKSQEYDDLPPGLQGRLMMSYDDKKEAFSFYEAVRSTDGTYRWAAGNDPSL